MKKLLAISALFLLSFKAGDSPKTITITLPVNEWDVIYNALGKLPAEQTETIRAKIVFEGNKQLNDTTKK